MLLLAAAALTACQQNGDTRPSPPPGPRATPEQVIAYKTQAVAEIGVAPGWGKPELLLSVNTEGW